MYEYSILQVNIFLNMHNIYSIKMLTLIIPKSTINNMLCYINSSSVNIICAHLPCNKESITTLKTHFLHLK